MSILRRRREAPDHTTEPIDSTRIVDVRPRENVVVVGQVMRMRARPTSGLPSLEVVVDDGSGRIVAIWSGRRAIGGITLGRRISLAGVVVDADGGPTLLNPTYELLK